MEALWDGFESEKGGAVGVYLLVDSTGPYLLEGEPAQFAESHLQAVNWMNLGGVGDAHHEKSASRGLQSSGDGGRDEKRETDLTELGFHGHVDGWGGPFARNELRWYRIPWACRYGKRARTDIY